ncbi:MULTISPECIES: hypothetical protein [Spongiibacter]|uniref:hypothetical protein n=1 Tax=Spongiibacter TaxID=630749 RepID=UPI002352F9CE|nr:MULTISPECIES: hypothetical protein [Spongiibacter]
MFAAQPEDCLDWKVETLDSASNRSSCAYYMRDKVSTRFLVVNHCAARVSGVFSYTREDAIRPLSVQAFDVEPGQTEEVANPCDKEGKWKVEVSQLSY